MSLPISAPDNLDVIGERREGGVDMLIVTIGPVDDSDATCQRLEQKLNAYLCAALHPDFPSECPAAAQGRVRIFVSDSHYISDRARAIVNAISREALSRNVEVRIGDPVA